MRLLRRCQTHPAMAAAVRAAVVVVGVAGCTAPTPQPADCALYERCYLDDDGAGLAAAAAAEPACYGAYADDADRAVAVVDLRAAYGADGDCFRGGFGAETDAAFVDRCVDNCRAELDADCGRATSVCRAAAADRDAYCAARANAADFPRGTCDATEP